MRLRRLVAPGLLLAGATLVTVAVLRGSAQASIVVIFPLFTGSSLLFLTGVICLIVGFGTLPWSLWEAGEIPAVESYEPEGAPDEGTGDVAGVIVLGPVPIFVGRRKNASNRVRWTVALVGLAILLVALFFVFPFRW